MSDNSPVDNKRRWTMVGYCEVTSYAVEVTVGDDRGDTYGPFSVIGDAQAFGERWAGRIADDLDEGDEWSWEIHEILAVPADLAARAS